MPLYVAYYRVSTDKQGIRALGMDVQREAVAGKSDLAACLKRRAVPVIAKLDRLARNGHFISGLMNSDVEFVAMDMPSANRLTIHIRAAVAEHERETISQRTEAALTAAKARGTKLAKPSRSRGRSHRQSRAAHPAATARGVKARDGMEEQGMGLREISRELNRLNIRTPQGCQWYASTVRNLLDSSGGH